MKLNVKIPTSLKEITLKQYKKFLKIQENTKDERFLNAKMIEIFCDIKLENVMLLKLKDSQEITNILYKLFDEKPNLVTKFNLNKKEYGFHPQLDELTLGEYIDLENDVFLLDMPMDAVMSSIFFLWNLGLDLSKIMTNSLDNEETKILTQYLSSVGNGVGINQFMDSLKGTLEDLKISLN